MKKNAQEIYGILARFPDSETLVSAARRAAESGYCQMDAYTPFPVEDLSEALRLKPSRLPFAVLGGGVLGGLLGFLMQYYATVIDMPLNIGGRPLNSWPAYIPITFELTILLAAFGGVLGLFVVTGFPQPYHPVFNVETSEFLENMGAILVSEIEA
jgi:hypothetical protein